MLDPLAASRMESTNARRIVRALEVTLGAGRPFSSYGEGLVTYGPARVVQVALQSDFEQLDLRIAGRFHAWMDQGLLEEVVGARQRPGRAEPNGAPGRRLPRAVASRRRGRRPRGVCRGRDHPESTTGPSTALVVPARPSHRVVRRRRQSARSRCLTC